MLKQSDIERERYEARLKAERDRGSSLLAAEQRGEQRTLIRYVHLFQDMLKCPRTAPETLLALPLAELQALADQLEAELRRT